LTLSPTAAPSSSGSTHVSIVGSHFFERAPYRAVRGRLAPDLQTAVTITHTYGWRVQEILRLEGRQLDIEAGTLRLDPGTTKNDEGRVVYLTPELARLLGEQLERVRAVERKMERIIPHLFPHLSGQRRIGQRRPRFPQGLGHRLRTGQRARPAPSRLPPDGGAEPRERGRA